MWKIPAIGAAIAQLLTVSAAGQLVIGQSTRQGPSGADVAADCTVTDSCPVDSLAALAALPDTAAIAFADALGADQSKVADMVRANPNIRIATEKSEADFILATLPEFPATLVLINNQRLFSGSGAYRRYDGSDDAIAMFFDAIARQPGFAANMIPAIIGDIDEAATATTLNAEIQTFLWARRLLAFRNHARPAPIAAALPKAGEVLCDGDENRRTCSEPFSLTVNNAGPDAGYFAVLQIDERWQVAKLVPWDGEQQTLLPALGSSSYSDDGFVREALLNQHYVTISSSRPIDLGLLSPRPGRIGAFPSDWQVAVVSSYKPAVGGGGGVKAGPLTAPWQAQLYSTKDIVPPSFARHPVLSKVRDWHSYERTHRCAGSLIQPLVILTAAHCLANDPFRGEAAEQTALKLRRVKLGTQNLQVGGTTYGIDAIVIHKDYRAGQNHHDIALVRLKPDRGTRPPLAAAVRAIELAAAPPAVGDRVDWTGWGATQEAKPGDTSITAAGTAQRYPAALQTGSMQAIATSQCKGRPGYGHVTALMLCAVTHPDSDAARRGEHVFTCRNDSGGPITKVQGGKRVLVGVISWAVGCGINDNPSVSVNVAAYRTWIRQAMSLFVTGKSRRY